MPASGSDAGGHRLRISLLGPMKVELDGVPLMIRSRKARGLLAYLLHRQGEDISRETLCSLFWGDRSDPQARASLRQTLSELRRQLGVDAAAAIVARRETIGWLPDRARVDTVDIVAGLAGDDARAAGDATRLLRGEFLEGLSIAGAPFEDWLAGERERFRQLGVRLHLRMMERSRLAGDPDGAVSHGLALLALDPLQESVHRTVMRLHADRGHPQAALEQYERCRRAMLRQLGVAPDAETEALVRSIRAGRERMSPARSTTGAVSGAAPGAASATRDPGEEAISLLVLPFDCKSGDPDHVHFADGITEDIIGALSQVRDLSVLSGRSSFASRKEDSQASDVLGELDVRYVLEGSLRISAGAAKVAVRLLEAGSGVIVWADHYEGASGDVFARQDDITRRIAIALQGTLTEGEAIRLWEGQTKNLRAWECMVRARKLFYRFTLADNAHARRLLENAVSLDPSFTGARALLGMTLWYEARYNLAVDMDTCLRSAESVADELLTSNPNAASAVMLKGAIALLRGRHDDAVRLCETAVELAPGDPHNLGMLGLVNLFAGRNDAAAAALLAADRHSPRVPAWCTYNLAMATMWSGRLPEAKDIARRYLGQAPGDPFGYVNLAAIHESLCETAEAAAVIERLRRLFPDFSLRLVERAEPYRDPSRLSLVTAMLRSNGVPA